MAAGRIGAVNVAHLQVGGHPIADLPVPNSLPRRSATFVDRAGDLARISAVAQNMAISPAVCVVDGMPGIGKSALVVHAAHRLAADYPDGQVYLDLRAYTPGAAALWPIEALGLLLEAMRIPAQHLSPSIDGRVALWRSLVATRKLLIVLDNVRTLEEVEPLLPGSGNSLTLITSRHRLDGPDTVTIPLQTLPPPEAARLLVRNAGLGDATTELDVAGLVAGCDHLPLAINLAAAWLRKHPTWAASELAAPLRGGDAVPQLHGEDTHITAAFELSYRDLGEETQGLFRNLGLHPGTEITVEAAAALGGMSTADARRHLEELFDHHLVQGNRPGRYQLHDLLRRFARRLGEAHDEAWERTAVIRRLLDEYLRQARSVSRLLPSATAEPPPDIVGGYPPADGYPRALRWFALESANLVACAGYAAQAPVLPHEKYAQARMLLNMGIAYLHQADYPAAHESLDASHALFSAIGDRRGEALTLIYLGATNQQQGRYRQALADLATARQIFVDLGDQYGEAEALSVAGVVELQLGQRESALESLGRALRYFRRIGDRYQESKALTHIGVVHERLTGDYEVALNHVQDALHIKRELGDLYGEAWAWSGIGIVQRLAGDLDSALASLGKSLRLHRDIGDRQGEGQALVHLGAIQRSLGDLGKSADLLREALAVCRAIGNNREEARALAELGALRLQEGQFDDARSSLDRACRVFREMEDVRGTVHALTVLGDLLLTTGNPDEARQVWGEADTACQERSLPDDVSGPLRARIAALPHD